MIDGNKIMQMLQAPFPMEEVVWRVGSTNKEKTKGLALAYITNRAIQNRLDGIFGCFGWRNEFKEWKGVSQLCGISIWDEVKSEWITKWDGSDDSNMDKTKGGLSDAMKRCGYQWGIGRYLYNLPQSWVNLKGGKYIENNPTLPSWALPTKHTEGATLNGNNKTTNTSLPPLDNTQELSKLSLEHGLSLMRLKKTILKDFNKTSIDDLTAVEYLQITNKILNK
jgi:hypothetical protein